MTTFSVISNTIRTQPHWDWLFLGLSRQTFKDFEIIIIDDAATRERYLEANKLAEQYHLRLGYYGKAKPSIWIRNGFPIRPAISNAKNTAIIQANSPWTAWIDDNGYPNPQWLAVHFEWARYGLMSTGAQYSFKNGEPSNTLEEHPANKRSDEKVKLFYKGEMADGFDARWDQAKDAIPCPPDWFHGNNMAFSLEAALAVNGFDEIFDGEQGQEDVDFAIRMRRAGFKMVFDPRAQVYYNNTSHLNTQQEANKLSEKGARGFEKIARKPKERILWDGIPHFSNEWITQTRSEKYDFIRANPTFNLSELRMKVRTQFSMDHVLPPAIDWRDSEKIEDMR